MSKDTYFQLIEKYINGTATPDEEAELLDWYRNKGGQEVEWVSTLSTEEELVKSRIFANIVKNRNQRLVRKLKPWLKIAASLLVAFSLGLFLFNKSRLNKIADSAAKTIILPGTNKATLILANGTKVLLDESKNGLLARQGSVVIKKSKSGQIIYDLSSNKGDGPTGDNTIITPRGGQYQVILPDGSKVWLNAASSLKFPTSFKGKERRVELKGEAYFEVAKNKAMPFRIDVNKTQVEVLGTHFDVMGYPEEKSTNTTLLEGSVKIISGKNLKVIKPGEQSKVGGAITVAQVDTEQAIAWKNGFFVFNDENIHTLMNQISRWYDVDITYKDGIDNQSFGGVISKYKDVSQILKKMELTNTIHFKIEGRRITVMK